MPDKLLIESLRDYTEQADQDKAAIISQAILLLEHSEFVPDLVSSLREKLPQFDRAFICRTLREATHHKNALIEINEIGEQIE